MNILASCVRLAVFCSSQCVNRGLSWLAEVVKRWFYRHHSYRIEQVLIPKRRIAYLSRSTRLVQDIAAVVSLHSESEISFSSLLDELSKSPSFPIDSDQVLQNLQHLRRGGLITVDWHKRLIKREAPMNEYMMKRVVSSECGLSCL